MARFTAETVKSEKEEFENFLKHTVEIFLDNRLGKICSNLFVLRQFTSVTVIFKTEKVGDWEKHESVYLDDDCVMVESNQLIRCFDYIVEDLKARGFNLSALEDGDTVKRFNISL